MKIIFLFLFMTNLYAGSFCSGFLDSIRSHFKKDSGNFSAEIEISAFKANNDNVIDYYDFIWELIQPKNDLVKSLFPNISKNKLKKILKNLDESISIENPYTLKWSKISDKLKLDILNFVNKTNNQNFNRDKNIKNFEIKEFFEIYFPSKTLLFGKTYSKGNHSINLREIFLMNDIHYLTSEDIKNFTGIELHHRTFDKNLISDFKKFFKLAEYPQKRFHIHKVLKYPNPNHYLDKQNYSFNLSSFILNLNIYSEMISIVQKNISIKKNFRKTDESTIIFFDVLNFEKLQLLSKNYFQKTYYKDYSGLDSQPLALKMNYVGFHPPSKYKGSKKLFGLEFRTVDTRHEDIYKNFIDKASKRLEKQGVLYTEIPNLKNSPYLLAEHLFKSNPHFNTGIDDSFNGREVLLNRLMQFNVKTKLVNKLIDFEYLEYRYLITPFENSYFLKTNFSLISKIKNEREKSIILLNKISIDDPNFKKKVRSIVKNYLKSSGLYDYFYSMI